MLKKLYIFLILEIKSINELIKNLQIENKNIIIKTTDVIYYYLKRRRNNFFGTKLSNKDNKQFFVDITYKIIPFKYHPYKLLTIKTFNCNTKNTKLYILIAIKFEDEHSFFYTLKYIKDFFNFTPGIINIDLSYPLYKVIKCKSLIKI